MNAPGWQTSELDEEWPDTSLPGSSRRLSDSTSASSSTSSNRPSRRNHEQTSQKFGSLRSMGSGLPSRTPFRVVSGHTQNSMGSLLAPPVVGTTPQDAEREKRRLSGLSPPNSIGGSSGGKLGDETRENGDTSQQDQYHNSPQGTGPIGTFLVKETDEEEGPPKHLLRNPFLNNQAGGGAVGGLFQPLALESMFQPPPATTSSSTSPGQPSGSTSGSRSNSGTGSGCASGSGSETAENPSPGAPSEARSTSPTSPVPSSLRGSAKAGLRRTSHSYVPVRPSRLSESISPSPESSISKSVAGSVHESEQQEFEQEHEHSFEQEGGSSSNEQEGLAESGRTQMRRFSGQKNSMQDVSFTFSPRRNTPPGSGSYFGYGESQNASTSTPVPAHPVRASLKLFSLRDSVAVYPVNDEKGLETPLAAVSAGRKKREENKLRQAAMVGGCRSGSESKGSADLIKGNRGVRTVDEAGRHEGGKEDCGEEADPRGEEEMSTDEEMRERKPKRIRLDSPSIASGSGSGSPSHSFSSDRQGSFGDRASPASSRRQHRSLSSTPSFASDRSPVSVSLNDTQRLKFHIGLSSPQPENGAKAAGNRQSWEQRGVEMLQHIRSRLLVDGNGHRSVAASPSTITNSGSEQSPESSGRRESSYDGTMRERSGSLPDEGREEHLSIGMNNLSPDAELFYAARPSATNLPATRTSSANTAIYVGPDRVASQTTSSGTVRGPMGPSGTVNSLSSGSGGTVTTSGSSSTVTSKYLSAGMDIMDRIRERKFSESSGTQTGPEHEGDARSSSSAGRPASSQSQNCQDADDHNEAAADLRRSRMASLRAQSASQPRPVRSVASSSSIVIGSQVSNKLSSLHIDGSASPAPPHSTIDSTNGVLSATTATTHRLTATAVSASSVKPRAAPPKPRGLQSMGLDDIPQMPSQVGKMIFDRQHLKWVRASGVRGVSGIGTAQEEGESSEGSSFDVFAGLESLRDDRTAPNQSQSLAHPSLRRSSTAAELDVSKEVDNQEGWTTRQEETRGEPSERYIEPDQEDCVSLDDVEVEIDEQSIRRSISTSRIVEERSMPINEGLGRSDQGTSEAFPDTYREERPTFSQTQSAPTLLQASAGVESTPLRSALRIPGSTPASALRKNSTLWNSPMKDVTDSATKRNVSFSDGKRPGKAILPDAKLNSGRHRDGSARSGPNQADPSEDDVFHDTSSRGASSSLRQQLPSARSQRIRNFLEDIESETAGYPTPTRVSHGIHNTITESDESSEASQSHTETESDSGRVHVTSRRESRNVGNATFLTECSFAVSHDKLVEIITEVQPFEPYWEDLTAIDLSKRGATSVARLKEFLPKLDEVNLNDNEISYLSGIPPTVRTLFAAGNKISSLTAVNHLSNIQYLDLSRNDLDGVSALSCLRHLREIKIDHNRITDLGDLLQTDSLVKMSCVGNRIAELDLRQAKWPRLETLDLSDNDIAGVFALERLGSLVTLNLESNNLTELVVAEPITSLRILRISNNDVAEFDLSLFPRLRTLYADNNSLSGLDRSNPRTLSRLENLSLRNQRGTNLRLSYDDLRDVKRLYISGNPLAIDFFPSKALYSMAYLEAAACKLSEWPVDFARRLPNLRHLNLNYNFIENLAGLRGLQGLRKLSVIGGRLGTDSTRGVVADLRELGTLESVDLRMNPCTLNFYLPVIVTDTAAFCALRMQDDRTTPGSPSWISMDVNFRRSLPDEWYSKRLIYRGLVAMACEGIQTIDGLQMSNAERAKAGQLVESALADVV